MTILEAIEIVIKHLKTIGKPQTRILLCIDEIMKVSSGNDINFENVGIIYTQLTEALDSTYFIWSLVTSLDYTPLFDQQSRSGRVMHWIPLPRAPQEKALKLFEQFYIDSKNPKFRLRGDFMKEHLDAAIAFCSGHFRSLMYLHNFLQNSQPTSIVDCLNGMYMQYLPKLEVIAAAIVGEPVSEIDIDGKKIPVATLIRDGQLINTLTENLVQSYQYQTALPTLVPLVSLVATYKVCKQVKESSNDVSKSGFAQQQKLIPFATSLFEENYVDTSRNESGLNKTQLLHLSVPS